MRATGIALATALVAVMAGTASAQQPISIDLSSLFGGSMGGQGSGSVPKVNEKPGATTGLEGITLTAKQSEELAKLDSARAKSVADAKTQYPSEAARAGAVAAVDKQHTASVRALLTDEQRKKFDENMAAQKAKDDAASRAQNAQGGGQVFQIQMGGGGGGGMSGMVIQATPVATPAPAPAPTPAPAATPDTTHK